VAVVLELEAVDACVVPGTGLDAPAGWGCNSAALALQPPATGALLTTKYKNLPAFAQPAPKRFLHRCRGYRRYNHAVGFAIASVLIQSDPELMLKPSVHTLDACVVPERLGFDALLHLRVSNRLRQVCFM
jgi:hypothetical protein